VETLNSSSAQVHASSRGRAILMLVLATGAWGLSFPGGKALMAAMALTTPGRDPWFYSSLMIAARFGLGALVLWLASPRAFGRMRASEWRQGIGLGLMGGFGMLIQSDGLAFAEASTSAFLTQFSTVLVPLIIALRTRRLPSALVLFCIALVVAGVAVLSRLDWHSLHIGRGELETLISTGFFSVQILWLDRPVFRGNDTGRVTLIMFLTIALVLTPVVLLHTQHAGDLLAISASLPVFALFVSLTLACSIFAFVMMNSWQPRVDPTTATIVYCTEPLFATLFALVLPAFLARAVGVNYANETATFHLVVGGALITAANVLISFNPQKREDGVGGAT
jgi:drug/metabolite transporter (DMT)-like permease